MTATPQSSDMPGSVSSDSDAHWHAWHAAVRRPDVDRGIRRLYEQLDDQVRSRGPTCWLSGKCCNFDPFGHRLYVTALEIAWVVAQTDKPTLHTGPSRPTDLLAAVDPHGPCPFQVDKLCSIHAVRPLGCRIFFCQEGTAHWQHQLYEDFLTKLRRLHDQHALPYQYMEWRQGLRQATACR